MLMAISRIVSLIIYLGDLYVGHYYVAWSQAFANDLRQVTRATAKNKLTIILGAMRDG